MKKSAEPKHPGLVVKEYIDSMIDAEQEKPLDVTNVAADLRVPLTTFRSLCHGKGSINGDLARKLAVYFPKTDVDFWLNLEKDYQRLLSIHQNSDLENTVLKRKLVEKKK